MKVDAVFEGGGVKGIGFVGAINCLEENGFIWEKLAGTSAGSIAAALLAVGYRGTELKDIMMEINYKSLLKRKHRRFIPEIEKYISLFKNYGVYSTDEIENFISKLFIAKGKTKFKDVLINGESRLKIIAADVTKKDILILPDDLVRYNIDPLNFNIARAVRMSISIPLYFKPVTLNYDNKVSYIVDGGIVSNFPIWIFDSDTTPRWPTFGFKFKDHKVDKYKVKKGDFISYVGNIIDTAVDKKEERYIVTKNRIRTIEIDSYKIKSTNFNISKENVIALYNSGYSSAEQFLKSWNFNEYIKRYRGSNIS